MQGNHDTNRWDDAVEKLIRLTESGELQWRMCNLPLRPLIQAFVGPQYVTDVESRRVAIYEYSFPTDSDEFGRYMDSSSRVEFVDSQGEVVWVWPVSRAGKYVLLQAVRYQSMSADKFLADFLSNAAVS